MTDSVRIVEVGPRDGLQSEPAHVAIAERVRFIELLLEAGLTDIEAGSFVSPRWVPQMADSDQVLRAVQGRPARFPVLVPNEQGLDAALAAGARDIAVFAAATETFSQRNINCSIAASIDRFRPVVQRASAAGIRTRGYISCVLGCPYEGPVSPAQVAAVAEQLLSLGCHEISLGDTIGVGTPRAARDLIRTVAALTTTARLGLHFHDTYGQALANILACLEEGVRVVDAAAGGLGGCPYARGATGNVATEDVVYMLDGLGLPSGVDLERLCEAAWYISDVVGRTPGSHVAQARGRRKAADAVA